MLGQPLFAINSREICKMRLCAGRGLNTPRVRFYLVARVSDSWFVMLRMAPPADPLSAWAVPAGASVHHERTRVLARSSHCQRAQFDATGGVESPEGLDA